MDDYYQNILGAPSRRRYRVDMIKLYGTWLCIRLHSKTPAPIRAKAFEWCRDLQSPWGKDFTGRRFYFANTDDAVMFKLAWGGNLV